jgi:hypothetical protein
MQRGNLLEGIKLFVDYKGEWRTWPAQMCVCVCVCVLEAVRTECDFLTLGTDEIPLP